MSRILIIHSSTDGHTIRICARLQELLQALGDQVVLVAVDQASADDLDCAEKIIIGASIRYGRHNKRVYEFVDRYRRALERKPNAFFSVNIVARKPGKNTPETNPYLRKFLGQIAWKPAQLAVFAGKLDYQKYTMIDRTIIRMIMWITHGPTDPQANIEFTDWDKVAEFGRLIHRL